MIGFILILGSALCGYASAGVWWAILASAGLWLTTADNYLALRNRFQKIDHEPVLWSAMAASLTQAIIACVSAYGLGFAIAKFL